MTQCFANLTVLALEEVLIPMRRSSRAITFRFDGKTQLQTCLLLYFRHVLAPRKGTESMQSSINLGETLFRKSARMNSLRPNSLRRCLYINHISYPSFFT